MIRGGFEHQYAILKRSTQSKTQIMIDIHSRSFSITCSAPLAALAWVKYLTGFFCILAASMIR